MLDQLDQFILPTFFVKARQLEYVFFGLSDKQSRLIINVQIQAVVISITLSSTLWHAQSCNIWNLYLIKLQCDPSCSPGKKQNISNKIAVRAENERWIFKELSNSQFNFAVNVDTALHVIFTFDNVHTTGVNWGIQCGNVKLYNQGTKSLRHITIFQ